MKLLLISIFCISMLACRQQSSPLVQEKDYAIFISAKKLNTTDALNKIDAELKFWKDRSDRMPMDIISATKMASLLSRRFNYSGNITEIKQADSLFGIVNIYDRRITASGFRSLANVCVTQHEFRKAKLYLDSALELGDDKYATYLQQFDVYMELGNFKLAKQTLERLGNKDQFEIIIRNAKYQDHVKGDLPAAIIYMKKALIKAKEYRDPSIYIWAMSNLGDMYSNDNNFKKAYAYYLASLKLDNEYYHSLKGIAWLAFSHDRNTAAAKKIMLFLSKKHPMPDYYLFFAEIASYEGNTSEQEKNISLYLKSVISGSNDDIYDAYTYTIWADKENGADEAVAIAEKEVINRLTPQFYSMLSYAWHLNGNNHFSLSIARKHVEEKSLEPDVIYRLAKLYEAGGDKVKARKYMKLAKEAVYKLGPAYIQL